MCNLTSEEQSGIFTQVERENENRHNDDEAYISPAMQQLMEKVECLTKEVRELQQSKIQLYERIERLGQESEQKDDRIQELERNNSNLQEQLTQVIGRQDRVEGRIDRIEDGIEQLDNRVFNLEQQAELNFEELRNKVQDLNELINREPNALRDEWNRLLNERFTSLSEYLHDITEQLDQISFSAYFFYYYLYQLLTEDVRQTRGHDRTDTIIKVCERIEATALTAGCAAGGAVIATGAGALTSMLFSPVIGTIVGIAGAAIASGTVLPAQITIDFVNKRIVQHLLDEADEDNTLITWTTEELAKCVALELTLRYQAQLKHVGSYEDAENRRGEIIPNREDLEKLALLCRAQISRLRTFQGFQEPSISDFVYAMVHTVVCENFPRNWFFNPGRISFEPFNNEEGYSPNIHQFFHSPGIIEYDRAGEGHTYPDDSRNVRFHGYCIGTAAEFLERNALNL